AWAGFPYEQLNKARITNVQLTAHGFDVQGEGAAAYDSSLELKRYLRRLTMNSDGKINVTDAVESAIPHTLTEVLHSDTRIEKKEPTAEQKFQTNVNDVALHIHLISPPHVVSTIEQNVVMGPGKPGSVDKGTLEPRGERLIVSTPEKVTSNQFEWELLF